MMYTAMPPKSRGLAEAAHRDARHHVGDEFVVAHDAGGHVALDPAGQDRIRGDAVAREFDRERAAQRVQRRFGAGVVLVARGAEQRRQARGRDQPAELVAGLGALGHVAGGDLEHMEHAVEIGREHSSPFLLGAVDEGAPSAAADAGIGKAAVDPAEGVERGLHRGLDRGGIGDVADLRVDLAGPGRPWLPPRSCSCRRCGPRSRRCSPGRSAPARCRGRCRHCRR